MEFAWDSESSWYEMNPSDACANCRALKCKLQEWKDEAFAGK